MGRIVVNLDVEMAKRKMSLSELAERVGLTTLEAICRELGCQPGDILEYRDE